MTVVKRWACPATAAVVLILLVVGFLRDGKMSTPQRCVPVNAPSVNTALNLLLCIRMLYLLHVEM